MNENLRRPVLVGVFATILGKWLMVVTGNRSEAKWRQPQGQGFTHSCLASYFSFGKPQLKFVQSGKIALLDNSCQASTENEHRSTAVIILLSETAKF